MLKHLLSLTAVALLSGTADPGEERVMSFFDLKSHQLNGTPVSLSEYRGKVLLVVNTASECGFTPQYEGLERLWNEYKDKGVVVLGIPSNDFGGQEPGDAQQIARFCELRYKVTFPMLEKVKTTSGAGQSPLYEFLARKYGAPKWNFHKYVVGKDGQVRAAFASPVRPDNAELRSALDKALAE